MSAAEPGMFEMETQSGHYLDLVTPDPIGIHLQDIAGHLSKIGRFNGASARFYSVAEHSLNVAKRVEAMGGDETETLIALHHDSAEAYLGDVGRPLKGAIGSAYVDLSSRMDKAIAIALGLPRAYDSSVDHLIKEADLWALSAEAFHLLPSRGKNWISDGLYEWQTEEHPLDTLDFMWRIEPEASQVAEHFVAEHEALIGFIEDQKEVQRKEATDA